MNAIEQKNDWDSLDFRDGRKPQNQITWPTIQQQIDYWNKKEGEELDRVSRIQDNCECEDCLKEEREREEATSEWYDELERKYRLVDEGRTFDGEGESYAERNA